LEIKSLASRLNSVTSKVGAVFSPFVILHDRAR